MSAAALPLDPATEDRLLQLLQSATAALEKACALKPVETTHVVDVAEVAIGQLRDGLIEFHRAAETPSQARRLHATLDQVNAVLSLIVGLEYPAAGVQSQT